MFADMHTHCEVSHDSVCKIEDMLLAQREKGVHIFAVTDHCDTIRYREMDIYTPIKQAADEVKRLRVQYPDMEILTGVELGDGFLFPDVTKQVLSLCDYDVVIASTHFITVGGFNMSFSDVDFSAVDMKTIRWYLAAYFDDLLKTVETVDGDILPHIDYPFRYVTEKYLRDISITDFTAEIEQLLKKLIARGMALEVNTAHPKGVMPFLLKRYYALGGRLITLGSDAHTPENAAIRFKIAAAVLKDIGFDAAYYFKQRKPYALPLR